MAVDEVKAVEVGEAAEEGGQGGFGKGLMGGGGKGRVEGECVCKTGVEGGG